MRPHPRAWLLVAVVAALVANWPRCGRGIHVRAVELASDAVFEDGELRISAYQASHPPIDPALGFRVDYRGRSVVISGDSNVTDATVSISDGADLLLHDALSVPAVTSMSEGFCC